MSWLEEIDESQIEEKQIQDFQIHKEIPLPYSLIQPEILESALLPPSIPRCLPFLCLWGMIG